MRVPPARGGRLAAVATALVLVAACGSTASTTTTAASSAASVSTSPSTPTTTPTPRSETPVPTTSGSSRPASAATSATGPMLWPFADAAAVAAWKAGYNPGSADAWHLDAGQTALRFVRDFLGYTELDRVTSTSGSTTQAVIGVGSITEGTTVATAGLLRLTRAGDTDPWEVVGTQDSDLTVTTPAAGQAVTSPLTVSGMITGVDESIAVALRAPAVNGVLGRVGGIGAGGTQQPWTASVPFTAPARTTMTVAVSTGGHLQAVERFAVTGAVTR